MYAYFKGIITYKTTDTVIIDVNSIGYEVYMSETEINKINIDEKLKIYTHLHVREDGLKLFGFTKKEELAFFQKLIGVSGVGPKMAIGIISNISVSDMCIAIATENLIVLKNIPGIGPKMAQKIIFELKDKVLKENPIDLTKTNTNIQLKNTNVIEAITALEVLGFSRKVIENVINKLEITNDSVEDIIKQVLKNMQN